MARRQAEVATRAAADFEAAGDLSMAAMLRGHADHLPSYAAMWPATCTLWPNGWPASRAP